MMSATHNDSGNALGRVAASLEMLRHDGENARRQSHVEDTVSLGATGLEPLKMLVQLEEGLILVVLAGDVGAQLAKLLKLLLDFLGRGLDI
jgi:hypothetical protein